MQVIQNFWDQTHPLSAKAEELYQELVPTMGNCETLQGELLRASSKISYDWYNNGWGCNNWSGAVIFLRDHIADLPITLGEEKPAQDFHAALREVHGYSHGEPADISNTRADRLVTDIHNYVVRKILANPDPIPNTLDMWNFGEPDAPYEDDVDYSDMDEDDEDDEDS